MSYVQPIDAPPYATDDDLHDQLQPIIVGITGIDQTLVRPRWQPKPPQTPEFDVNWIAFGETNVKSDTFVHEQPDPAGDSGNGTLVISKDQEITLLFSFYGPLASAICEQFRDGVVVQNNREALAALGFGIIDTQDAIRVPALLRDVWVNKVDMTLILRRRVKRTYKIPFLLSGQFGLDNERYVTQLTTP